MSERLKEFFQSKPERIIKWEDNQSDAVGWLVINSLYNGAAGGGTRMHSKCTESEITQLAKTMEIKFTVSGPSIGGAKSGIRYNYRNKQEKLEVLSRWFTFIRKELMNCYGTGGDQNVDMNMDVIPILSKLGIPHPQLGIVNGLYPNLSEKERTKTIQNLIDGVVLKIEDDRFLSDLNFSIADIATGFGVASSIKRYYERFGEDLSGKNVIIEGFGNVGTGTAYFISKYGAKVVGILDKNWYIVDKNGINIKDVIHHKRTKNLRNNSNIEMDKPYINSYPEAHIFIPAATSHTINKSILRKLKVSGIELIAMGANNAFVDYDTEIEADQAFSVIPDFIANAGMARCFSYLMQKECEVTEKSILEDIRTCINTAVDKTMDRSGARKNLSHHSYNIALDEIKSR